ncbi:MAG: hypothetical protein Q8P67_18270 [archaeon]|nr:hypothetical protein [archaeon]
MYHEVLCVALLRVEQPSLKRSEGEGASHVVALNGRRPVQEWPVKIFSGVRGGRRGAIINGDGVMGEEASKRQAKIARRKGAFTSYGAGGICSNTSFAEHLFLNVVF